MSKDISSILERHRPFLHDAHRYQIKLLEQRFVADKRIFSLRDLTELAVEIFSGIGRINNPADRLRALEHGGELVPVYAPGLHRSRIFSAPGGFQFVQRYERGFLRRCLIYWLQCCREGLDVFI